MLIPTGAETIKLFIMMLILFQSMVTGGGDIASHDKDPKRFQQASVCAKKMTILEKGQNSGPLTISEEELNAYLVVHQDRLFKSSTRDICVKLSENQLQFNAIANFEKANLKSESIFTDLFIWIFSGDQQVEAMLQFNSKDYQGIYTVQKVEINGILLPQFLVYSLAKQIGKRQNPSMVPGEPFKLPYHLKKCDFTSRGIVCHPGQRQTNK